jgi:hypothetical protein
MTWWSSNRPAMMAPPLMLLIPLVWAHMAGAHMSGPSPSRAAAAPSLTLALPVLCDMARECSIQKYVDRDAGADRLDYRCGMLTTDGHDGIDFRLRRTSDFHRDIKVVSATAGTVLRVRDGVPDLSVKDPAAPPLRGQLAGNAVVIGHGDGWETQYSHLKRGSLRVTPGDTVAAGMVLGAVGMSGNAEFPHLHFEVRHNGRIVDPFASGDVAGCDTAQRTLWNSAAMTALVYRPAEAVSAGFSATAENALAAYQKLNEPVGLNDPESVLLWGISSGVQPGDVERFEIYDPKRGVILKRETTIVHSSLQRVGYAGVSRPANGWVSGVYLGDYSLIRKGKILGTVRAMQAINEPLKR